MDDLCLPPGYRSRLANNDDWQPPDDAMNSVYAWIARHVAGDSQIKTVLDWGCGSGAMLVKHFGHLQTVGVDVPYRLPQQQQRFPTRRWEACPVLADADLIVCVDVIEHVDDPISLLQTFAAGSWRQLFVTTPDRALVAKFKCHTKETKTRQINGPPRNQRHTREWTLAEFDRLIRREINGSVQTKLIGRFNIVARVRRRKSAGTS